MGKKERAEYDKKYYQENKKANYYSKKETKDKRQNRHLKHKYGITVNDYNEILCKQNGLCAICGKLAEDTHKKILFVDHDHETKKVRGLLCNKCNVAIGFLDDSIDNLKSAIKYLEGSYNG